MKLSQKTREELYAAIREEIVDARIKLKLSQAGDFALSQVESKIWAKQKKVLKLPDYV